VLCRSVGAEVIALCQQCQQQLQSELVGMNSQSIYVPWQYAGLAKQLVCTAKASQTGPVAAYALGQMIATVLPNAWQGRCVLPMPSSVQRCWQRGFNPVEWMAKGLIQAGIARRYSNALQVLQERPKQGVLPRHHRLNNMQNSLVMSSVFPGNTEWLLIDDVVTTGATIVEAIRAVRVCDPAAHIMVLAACHGGQGWYDTISSALVGGQYTRDDGQQIVANVGVGHRSYDSVVRQKSDRGGQ